MPPLLVRPVAALLAVFWWVPMFGIIDLSVTWDPDWPVVLEASRGVFFTLVVGLPSMLVAVWPRAAGAALAQLMVAAASLVVAAVASVELPALVVGVLVAATAGVVAVLRGRPSLRPWTDSRDRPLAALATVSAVPWLAHAWEMAAANRADRYDSDVTNSVDHYSVQAALAVALVALTLLAAIRSRARRLHGTTVALAAGYLGLVSFAWPGTPADLGGAWSVLVLVWAVAVGVATWLPRSPAR